MSCAFLRTRREVRARKGNRAFIRMRCDLRADAHKEQPHQGMRGEENKGEKQRGRRNEREGESELLVVVLSIN